MKKKTNNNEILLGTLVVAGLVGLILYSRKQASASPAAVDYVAAPTPLPNAGTSNLMQVVSTFKPSLDINTKVSANTPISSKPALMPPLEPKTPTPWYAPAPGTELFS